MAEGLLMSQSFSEFVARGGPGMEVRCKHGRRFEIRFDEFGTFTAKRFAEILNLKSRGDLEWWVNEEDQISYRCVHLGAGCRRRQIRYGQIADRMSPGAPFFGPFSPGESGSTPVSRSTSALNEIHQTTKTPGKRGFLRRVFPFESCPFSMALRTIQRTVGEPL